MPNHAAKSSGVHAVKQGYLAPTHRCVHVLRIQRSHEEVGEPCEWLPSDPGGRDAAPVLVRGLGVCPTSGSPEAGVTDGFDTLANEEMTVDEPVLSLASAVVQPATTTTESRTSRSKSLLRSEDMCCRSLQGWLL